MRLPTNRDSAGERSFLASRITNTARSRFTKSLVSTNQTRFLPIWPVSVFPFLTVLPWPRITTERLHDKNVLIVDVNECETSQKPVFIKRKGLQNGAFRRIGSTDQLCNEDDIALLFGARNSQPFDQTLLSSATRDDIDAEAIEHYRTPRRSVNPLAEELNLLTFR